MTYREWKTEVDRLCTKHIGLSTADLEDVCDLRSLHGDELTPAEGLIEILQEQSTMPDDLLESITEKLGVEL